MSEPLTDVRDMRKAMRMAAWRGLRIDGSPAIGPSHAANLARTAHSAAEHGGLSGEDEMTVLAYHALRELEQVTDLLLQDFNTRVTAPVIVPKEQIANSLPGMPDWERRQLGMGPFDPNNPVQKAMSSYPGDKPADPPWTCLQCKSRTPGRHGTLDDGVTPCPNG